MTDPDQQRHLLALLVLLGRGRDVGALARNFVFHRIRPDDPLGPEPLPVP